MGRGMWFVALLCMAQALSAAEDKDPKAEAYDLHEWGVFSVPRNEAWAQRDMKAEWATFPEFFNRIWPEAKLPYHGPVRKPVIYLHANKKFNLSLTIRFTEGRPLVWWPPAFTPSFGIEAGRLDEVSFNLSVVDCINGQAPDPNKVEKGHWMETLRAPQSSLVFTDNGWSRMGNSMVCEHFIYYDGVMKAPPTPKVTRDGDAIVLESNLDYEMLDVIAIERLGKDLRVSKACVDKIETGAHKTRMEWIAADNAVAAGLSKRLAAAGLNQDEADALVKVWEDGFFKQPGLRVLYRIPQAVYDKWLPLQAKPAPAKSVRVGLVLHEHLQPELDEVVAALIKKLGDESFDIRDAARRELTAFGGAAFPALEKAAQGDDPEISKACRSIIESLDMAPALKAKLGPDTKSRW